MFQQLSVRRRPAQRDPERLCWCTQDPHFSGGSTFFSAASNLRPQLWLLPPRSGWPHLRSTETHPAQATRNPDLAHHKSQSSKPISNQVPRLGPPLDYIRPASSNRISLSTAAIIPKPAGRRAPLSARSSSSPMG